MSVSTLTSQGDAEELELIIAWYVWVVMAIRSSLSTLVKQDEIPTQEDRNILNFCRAKAKCQLFGDIVQPSTLEMYRSSR